MSIILNIDTATENAMISIAENSIVLRSAASTNQKDHATFLQPAIKQLLKECNLTLNQINAISITAGPGSYTGLRVGMSSAKGLCYALKIPLITLSTLEVMSLSVINNYPKNEGHNLFCPMIDARRMEIFTALYDDQLNEILSPFAIILSSHFMNDQLQNNKIIFFGSGAGKCASFIKNENALFVHTEVNCDAMATLSYSKFVQSEFADLPYAEPLYIKEFYTISNKSSSC